MKRLVVIGVVLMSIVVVAICIGVFGVNIPFVAKRADSLIQRVGLAGCQACHGGISPESQLAVLRRHGDIGGTRVDVEQLAG